MSYDTSCFSLEGKVALVTGAARGLGASAAEALAAHGATVMLTDVLADEGAATAAALTAKGYTAAFLAQDVVEEVRWQEVVFETIQMFGGFDVLVNNAGIESQALLADTSLELFRRIMTVNVEGVFLGTREAVRAMSPGGSAGNGGSIINLSSIAGLIGAATFSAYGASKGAVRSFSKHAAVECAMLATGIRVNSLHPGIVRTAMGDALFKPFADFGLTETPEEAEAMFLQMHPMGRFGQPNDIASAIVYLASDASSWVTGIELSVDGGMAAA